MKNTFLFSVIFILLISGIAAISWPFSKAVTCQNFNISGINCETFWCNSIQEGNYSIEKELCVLKEIINNTIYVNESEINATLNSSEFYNRSEIDIKIQDIKMNFTQNYLLKDDFNEFKDDFKDNKNSGNRGITGSEIVIGLLIAGVIIVGFYFANKKNKNQLPSEKGEAPILQKKIQTSKERELEKRITELEQKKLNKNKKTAKNKKEKSEDFDEDLK